MYFTLQWHHNERNGISNHQLFDGVLHRLFRRRSQKTSKLRVTGICEGNSSVTGEFPSQRASNVENVSIWWHHHVVALTKISNLIPVEGRTWAKYYYSYIYVAVISHPCSAFYPNVANLWQLQKTQENKITILMISNLKISKHIEAEYMNLETKPLLVQIMVWCFFIIKSFSKPIIYYWQLNPWEHISVDIWIKAQTFSCWKMHW